MAEKKENDREQRLSSTLFEKFSRLLQRLHVFTKTDLFAWQQAGECQEKSEREEKGRELKTLYIYIFIYMYAYFLNYPHY